jgi:hypothetical protein
MDWPNFFRGIMYSALPKSYWRSWRPSSTMDFERSAIVSGLLECFIALCLLILGYWHFLIVRTHQLRAASDTNEGTQLYMMAVLTLEYVFHPLSLIALCLAGEGALRSWAAFFTDDVVPSIPLRLAVFLRDRRQAKRREESFGPDLIDLVERYPDEENCLRICSTRPKEGWRPSISVAVQGEFYEVSRVQNGPGPRPFVYMLRKLPMNAIIRGAYRYDPPEGA